MRGYASTPKGKPKRQCRIRQTRREAGTQSYRGSPRASQLPEGGTRPEDFPKSRKLRVSKACGSRRFEGAFAQGSNSACGGRARAGERIREKRESK